MENQEQKSKSEKAGFGQQEKLNLDKLFSNGIREMLAAETVLLENLPLLADQCVNHELAAVLKEQFGKTERQKSRLEGIFQRLQISTKDASCAPITTLVSELKEMLKVTEESPARDAAVIITLQKIEHYQIAAYGSLYELAELLGFGKIARLLDRSLEEEELTDHLLTSLAWVVNDDALQTPQSTLDELK